MCNLWKQFKIVEGGQYLVEVKYENEISQIEDI
jgi:hypothetical protein